MADAANFDTSPGYDADDAPHAIAAYFDATFYLETYKDVGEAGIDPLQHWLNWGFAEGRQISRLAEVRHGKDAVRSSDRAWTHFRWQGQDVAIKLFAPLSQQVAAQIARQWRHDPAVLASGETAIPRLGQLDRENVHLDVAGLRRAIPQAAQFLLLIPNLEAAQGMIGDLAATLCDLGPIQIIVTEVESRAGNERHSMPELFERSSVLFWRDYWITGPDDLKIMQLAQLIRLLRPRAAIAANTPHGYEAIARFGSALAERTRLYCVYAGGGEDLRFKQRFAARTIPYSVALTEDPAVAASLREERGALSERQAVLLTPRDRVAFARQIASLFGSS